MYNHLHTSVLPTDQHHDSSTPAVTERAWRHGFCWGTRGLKLLPTTQCDCWSSFNANLLLWPFWVVGVAETLNGRVNETSEATICGMQTQQYRTDPRCRIWLEYLDSGSLDWWAPLIHAMSR